MIIKNDNFEVKIDAGGFVYFTKTISSGLGESKVEDQHMDWSGLSSEDEQEVIQIRAAAKALLVRGMALSKVTSNF